MPELSPLTQKLIKDFSRSKKENIERKDDPIIEVDEITLRVARFYEKIRGVIDWKGEHLLKRNVIERILKRKVFSKTALEADISSIPAEPFVIDLIRSGHFQGNRIRESKIKEVQNVLDKYVYIINYLYNSEKGLSVSFGNWISSIAACEIEDLLSGSKKEKIILFYAFNSIKKTVAVEKGIEESEKNILLFIALQQALFNLDTPIITYHTLSLKYKNWKNPSKEELEYFAQNLLKEKEEMDRLLNHPLLKKFYQFCKVYNTPYLIIGDILEENHKNAKELLLNPEKVEEKIIKHYEKRVEKMKGRLYRGATYSTISIFVTNVAALLAVEIPLSRYIDIGEFTYFVIAVDVLVPTLLMAFLIVTVSPPPNKNRRRVALETMRVLYKKENEEVHTIKKPKEKKSVLYFVVSLFYAISFLASVGIIVWLLSMINFPLLSYFIFIIFLSLIAFAGVKIRERSKELHMIEVKEGFSSLIVDIFALPVIRLGKWLTLRWEKYNMLSVVFSAFLDMPFKLFVEFLDQWRSYLKEKKEEIY